MENSMSIREKEKEKDEEEEEEESIPCHLRRKLATTSIKVVPNREVRLAAIAIGLNIRLRSTDMSAPLQERAFRYARALIDSVSNRGPKMTRIAFILKKEFDTTYGPAWHCIVGKSFGSFVTHSPGGFIYFSLGNLSFLLFKTEARRVIESTQ